MEKMISASTQSLKNSDKAVAKRRMRIMGLRKAPSQRFLASLKVPPWVSSKNSPFFHYIIDPKNGVNVVFR
jgi:hypothetical protein